MFNQVLMHTCLHKVIFADICINVQKWKENHQVLQEKSIVTCGIIPKGNGRFGE